MVEDLPIGLTEDQVNSVGRRAVRQPFPLKHDTVARKARFEAPLTPVAVPVAQLGDDIRAGILMEGALEISPFALPTLHILNFKLPVKMSSQPQPLEDGFLHR